jgi:glycosyltransferase involved in cell wall biosynthesis
MANLRILIVGEFEYPFGSAAASHMRLFAKGLRLAGADVRVLSQSRIPWRESDKQPDGTLAYEHTPYETSAGDSGAAKSTLLKRATRHIRSIHASQRRTRELILSREINAVLVDTQSFAAAQPLVSLCRQHHIPVIIYVVEWFVPSLFRGGIVNPLYWDNLLLRLWTARQCAGVLAISGFVERQYSRWGMPVLRVPTVFDFDAWTGGEQAVFQGETKEFNLTYAGNFKPTDGTLDMLEAIRIARRSGCPVRLTVVGSDGSIGVAREIYEHSQQDNLLRGNIQFLGRIPEEEYMPRLSRSDALILVRSPGVMSEGAFPNRLPEYLATERPVITTAVPDVPEYLTDAIHAHVVPPQRPDLVAERIIYLWKDSSGRRLLGRAGRRRAQECFDYQTHTRRILDFIRELGAR